MNKKLLIYFFAVLFLSIMFLAPALKVMGDSHESEESKTEDESSEEETSEEEEDDDKEKDKEKEDDDDDGVDDEREKAEEREIKVDFDEKDNKLKVESTLKTGETKNKIEFEIEAKNRIEFKFKFKTESADTESKVDLRFEFRRLIEFIDNSSGGVAGGYDPNDEFVQEIDFHDLTWNMYVSDELIGTNTVYTIVANTTLDSMGIEFSFYISSGYVQFESNTTLLQPSSVKFNVEINDFPFSDTRSSLAVEVKMKHKAETETNKIEDDTEDENDGLADDDEQQISYSNKSVGSFFSWLKTYTADGVNKTIIVSPVIDDNEESNSRKKMYFNFVQANNLFWDPKVGVTRDSTSNYVAQYAEAGAGAFGFEFIAILIIPIFGLITRRKLRN